MADRRSILTRCSLAYGPNPDHLCVWCGEPVAPGAPEPWCSNECRAAFDVAHVWPLARAAALLRNARRCSWCSRRAEHVHHFPETEHGYENGCAHHADRLTPLCRTHHRAAHDGAAKRGGQMALPLVA